MALERSESGDEPLPDADTPACEDVAGPELPESSPEDEAVEAAGKGSVVGANALISTLALFMFVGGALVSLMLVARSFDLHGPALVSFVVASCALVLAAAGSLACRALGDRWWVGAIAGACFGAISALLVYGQTRHYPWWQ